MQENGTGQPSKFVEALRQQRLEKEQEFLQCVHEQRRVAMRLERAKEYIRSLNSLLAAEGLPPLQLEAAVRGGIGQPGNRSKDMPIRRLAWDGKALQQIVSTILNESPKPMHANEIVHRVYEIENETDMRTAKRSLVSTLRAGGKKGDWEVLGKNVYGKTGSLQGALPIR